MFRVLRYVNEVYQTKSFSIAAQNLFISQPALSLTIKKFENEIGIQIFDRSSSPIQLTDAGRIYIKGLEKILEIDKQLSNFLDDYLDLNAGTLTLGAPHFFSSFLLPPIIAEFHRNFPAIEIKLVETDFLSLQERTMSGEIDLLIESSNFDFQTFHSYPLLNEHVLLAVPKTYIINEALNKIALNRQDIIANKHRNMDWPCVELRDFCDHSFLLLEKGHDMHKRAYHFFNLNEIEPRLFMSLNQLMTTYNLTNQQLGVSFVSDTIAKFDQNCQDIIYYKLDNDFSIRQVNVAHKKNRYISKPMTKFMEMMKAICEDIVAIG